MCVCVCVCQSYSLNNEPLNMNNFFADFKDARVLFTASARARPSNPKLWMPVPDMLLRMKEMLKGKKKEGGTHPKTNLLCFQVKELTPSDEWRYSFPVLEQFPSLQNPEANYCSCFFFQKQKRK